MANLDRWGGPLPSSYIESQADLQRHILGRVRSLGMKAILPAFAGHVPPQLVRLHPGAHVVPITPGWSGMPAIYATYFLDPSDPLFEDIQGRFLTEEVRMYGTDHLYAADPFNEIVPPSWEPAYLAHVSHSIYGGMAAADPDARWYQMSWTFLFDSLRSAWTPERLTTMLRAVPPGRMVLLDYAAEEQEFYSVTDNAYGLPFVWNYLGNFGGNTHLEAPLHKVATLGERAMRQPNCVGIGSTLEAIGVNPCVYTLLFELPWQPEDHSDLDAWITRYADLRAGGADPAVRRAWSKLREDVFRDNSRRKGTFGSIFQSMPPVVGWKGRTQNTHQDYPPEALVAALRDLFDAGPAARQADGYRFDVVNFTRQALCNYALTVEQQMVAAAQARDAKAFEREAQRFLELGGDLDDLLGTRREFLLGSWLADARALGTTFSEADYYERNAREIITAWHVPGGQLTDYASRQWNGLMRDYYLRRWEKWVALTTESLTHGTPFNDAAYLTWINEFTASWIEMHDAARYTVAPRGDDVVTARHLADKYLFTGAATDAPARP
jgi:alpha-N-acetylglucosaminidase